MEEYLSMVPNTWRIHTNGIHETQGLVMRSARSLLTQQIDSITLATKSTKAETAGNSHAKQIPLHDFMRGEIFCSIVL